MNIPEHKERTADIERRRSEQRIRDKRNTPMTAEQARDEAFRLKMVSNVYHAIEDRDPHVRIADALERIANAQEAQVMIFQALVADETKEPQGPPQTIMTQAGPIQLR